MAINTERAGTALIFTAEGRLDGDTAGEAQRVIFDLLGQGENRIVLDLARLDYISSAGLRVVLLAAKRLKQSGGALALCNLRGEIRQVFEISGFATILTICADRGEALARLGD